MRIKFTISHLVLSATESCYSVTKAFPSLDGKFYINYPFSGCVLIIYSFIRYFRLTEVRSVIIFTQRGFVIFQFWGLWNKRFLWRNLRHHLSTLRWPRVENAFIRIFIKKIMKALMCVNGRFHVKFLKVSMRGQRVWTGPKNMFA